VQTFSQIVVTTNKPTPCCYRPYALPVAQPKYQSTEGNNLMLTTMETHDVWTDGSHCNTLTLVHFNNNKPENERLKVKGNKYVM